MTPETVRKHFDKLRKLLFLEQAEEIEQFRREFEGLSPQEREKLGKALLHLSISDSHYSPGGHRLISFQYADGRKLPVFSFQTGDLVSLTREGLDVERTPFGTVYEKDGDKITVAFDWLHEDWLDEEGIFHLNRAGNRATFKRMLESLDTVEKVQHGRLARLRDISLGLVQPASLDPVDPSRLRFFNPDLNQWQKEAVARVLEAADLALIHGPPGTGKTTVLIEVIRQTIDRGKFVFATAPSNTACDNLVEGLVKAGVPALRLGHPARIMEHLRPHTLDFAAGRHPYTKEVDRKEKEIDAFYRRLERKRDRGVLSREERNEIREAIRSLKGEVRELERDILQQVLNASPVMIATHAGSMDRVLQNIDFDLVVMDEASQSTEPGAWIPLLKARKAVLAGDHFQLPPTVRSREAEEKGLGVTLFERLYGILDERFKTVLRLQYRMNETIMNFSSRQFYQGMLIADESVKNHVLCGLPGVAEDSRSKEPFLFLDTAGRGFEEKMEPGSESRYNQDEADIILSEAAKLLAAGVPPEAIAVISPYSAQVRLLSSKIPDARIEVDSVDGFQGREKEAVLLSLVRSNLEGELGFLADTRRMNVAMTRARRRLFVVGDSATLAAIPFYQNLIQYAELTGSYRSIWEYETGMDQS